MLPFHEVANIFPLLDGPEYEALKADIAANGQREPIWIYQGAIIDGRNRYLACTDLGIAPAFREWGGTGSLLAFVLSANLHRRHLSPSQAAAIGARARELYDEEARKRQAATRNKGSEKPVPVNLPERGDARDAVGKLVGVSGKSIDHATKVLRQGEPELIKAVDEGHMAVSKAAKLATEPPEVQREEAARYAQNRTGGGKRKTAGRARKRRRAEKQKTNEERTAAAMAEAEEDRRAAEAAVLECAKMYGELSIQIQDPALMNAPKKCDKLYNKREEYAHKLAAAAKRYATCVRTCEMYKQ
jgi:hypothetical protein